MRCGRVGAMSAEDGDRLLASERVGEIAEVGDVDQLLRRHVGEQPPQRLSRAAGSEVPDGVHNRGHRQVNDALLRAEPAQLCVGG